jgi:hypothetical protein
VPVLGVALIGVEGAVGILKEKGRDGICGYSIDFR